MQYFLRFMNWVEGNYIVIALNLIYKIIERMENFVI